MDKTNTHFSFKGTFKTTFEMKNSTAQDGDVYYCESDKKYYIFNNASWEEISVGGSSVTMTAYDINSQVMRQLDPLTREEILGLSLYDEMLHFPNKNFVLISWDLHYYTIFQLGDTVLQSLALCNIETLKTAITDCLYAASDEIYAIDPIHTDDGCFVYEIWARNPKDDTAVVMYLSNYDGGVIDIIKESKSYPSLTLQGERK